MFTRILIANRGEIACRIIRTAQRFTIETVAIYSPADQMAQHVKQATYAYSLRANTPQDSYLSIDQIIAIAKQSKAQAIHPGYGFLSENAEFAKKCEDEGIIFIGPSASAIALMGSKSAAKNTMQQAGIPVLPGYQGEDQSSETFIKYACQIGYPLLIKPALGGGGKGMHVVWDENELLEKIAIAQREATSSFGDDRLLLEKYLLHPRHIEIQIFGDQQGQYVYLFERECSIQRRHQKIIEEAPAPHMTPELRQNMGEMAIKAAKAINYRGAGTIEFLLDEHDQFYFMEMNTRLQVEHPITEMITGQDLVEWQLRIASNESLPLTQTQLKINGHAIEARIYAEDPNKDFLPSTGIIEYLVQPAQSNTVRIDSGFQAGDEISVYYDSLLAKLVVWAHNRNAATTALQNALSQYYIFGIQTNIDFLFKISVSSAFLNADINTEFVTLHQKKLRASAKKITNEALIAAAMFHVLSKKTNKTSPWDAFSGWRLNLPSKITLNFEYDTQIFIIDVYWIDASHFKIIALEETFFVTGEISFSEKNALWINVNDRSLTAMVVNYENIFVITVEQKRFQLDLKQYSLTTHQNTPSEGSLTAPMSGTIIKITIDKGQFVEAGQLLVVLEAMKMEHTITAPYSGEVEAIYFKTGDLVKEGNTLIKIAG